MSFTRMLPCPRHSGFSPSGLEFICDPEHICFVEETARKNIECHVSSPIREAVEELWRTMFDSYQRHRIICADLARSVAVRTR